MHDHIAEFVYVYICVYIILVLSEMVDFWPT